MKGASRFTSKPRRTDTAAMTWPVRAPNTASGAARRGSSVQAHSVIAVRPKPNPDSPCTKPARAATPATVTIRASIGAGPYS